MPSMSNTASTGSSRSRILTRRTHSVLPSELAQRLRDRRRVDVLQVVLPVDRGGVEGEPGAVLRGQARYSAIATSSV